MYGRSPRVRPFWRGGPSLPKRILELRHRTVKRTAGTGQPAAPPVLGALAVPVDPLRRSGRPVVRSVPTEVIAEQLRAGDSLTTIAEAYDLRPDQVEAAIRYELLRVAERAA